LQEDTRLLTADQVAKRLGVPKSWVYARARAGGIPAVRLGRYYRFRPQALEDWILEQEKAG
jgi:excisionase family DNA binding protein